MYHLPTSGNIITTPKKIKSIGQDSNLQTSNLTHLHLSDYHASGVIYGCPYWGGQNLRLPIPPPMQKKKRETLPAIIAVTHFASG
jgi:hypothetical protein